MREQSHEKGFVLTSLLVFMMVLCFIISGSLATAFAYRHKRVLNNAKEQAYLTARSVAELLAAEFTGTKTDEGHRTLIEAAIQDSNQTEVQLEIEGLPEMMGTCNIVACYEAEEDKLVIEVTAEKLKQVYLITASFYYRGAKEMKSGNWELAGYGDVPLEKGMYHEQNEE